MTIYFTSDLHFGHDRDFIYGPRGFKSIHDHDITIIDNWNNIVNYQDRVYVLGDLMLGANHQYGLDCLRTLRGEIHVVRGNHDTDTRWKEYEDIGLILHGYADIIKEEGYKFYLCHYPTQTSCIENTAPLKNHLINLHGHTHHKVQFETDNPFMYNVALDAHNCYPARLEAILTLIKNKCEECISFL